MTGMVNHHHDTTAAVRLDIWVWATRLYKTRTAATAAVRAGHVKLNGKTVKPAQMVVPGDTVRAWSHHREYIVTVVLTPATRVGAALAQASYIDHSPPSPSREIVASMPRRDRGAGRPTKKERRQIDELRGRRRP
ncbi:RNA-binding S4 domain-containing protein [Corynebacterium kroppenstedtii]|uniref:RNA-binding S4 domain-containing protein n=1 Tax=Corynebacterium sp. PCR 32 TaxID=3351342 RepID=UPI00309D4142